MGKNTKLTLTIDLIIFILIFLLHLLRLVFGWGANFAGWAVPMWLSWVALVLAAVLVWLNYKAV